MKILPTLCYCIIYLLYTNLLAIEGFVISSLLQPKSILRTPMSAFAREIVATDGAPAAIGPYSQAVKTNGMLYVSGCIGIKRELGKLVDGGIGAQTRQVMENMKAIVEAGGSSMDKVVKTTVLMTDISSYPEVNAIYAEFFSSDAPPARAAYAVAALPAGALIEIDCIAIASS